LPCAGSVRWRICDVVIRPDPLEGFRGGAGPQKVFMVDRFGLLTDKMPNLLPFQTKLVTSLVWKGSRFGILSVSGPKRSTIKTFCGPAPPLNPSRGSGRITTSQIRHLTDPAQG